MKTLILTILLTVSGAFAQETNKIQFIGDLHGAGTVAYPAGTNAPKWVTNNLVDTNRVKNWRPNVYTDGIAWNVIDWKWSYLVNQYPDKQEKIRIIYDAPRYVSVTWDSHTNLFINGINMRRFVELTREFSEAPPTPTTEETRPIYIMGSDRIVMEGKRIVVKRADPDRLLDVTKLTGKELRELAARKEAKQKALEAEQSRWLEYQAMIKQLDEVVK